MAQTLFAGFTDYNEQTLDDILEDVKKWKKMLENSKMYIDDYLEQLKGINKINSIGDDFRITILTSIKCFTTFISDFNIILLAIEKNEITGREIKLMTNIGKKACEYNNEYGKTWNIDNYGWKCYGESWFKLVEKIYARGRNMFVTLQDCSNVSKRLENYKEDGIMIKQNNIINGFGNISGINNGNMSVINNNFSNLENELVDAIKEITELKCPKETKKPFLELLTEISEKKISSEEAKKDFKSITIMGLTKAYKVISILSNFATLASFCGIQIK